MAKKRWSFEQETRQRFNTLIENHWTTGAIAAATGLSVHWVHSYRKNSGADYGVRKTQAIYDLYEDYFL